MDIFLVSRDHVIRALFLYDDKLQVAQIQDI